MGLRSPTLTQAERAGIQKLRLAPAVVLRVFGDDIRDFSCIGWAELALRPQSAKLRDLIVRPSLRIPGQAQEILDGKLHGLEIAYIDDPDAPGIVVVRQIHLLPNLSYGNRIEPFIIAWAAHIVEVVINTGAAASVPFFRSREPAQVTPVIVAPE